MTNKIKILNLDFDSISYDNIIDIINNNIEMKKKTLLDFPNAFISLLAFENQRFYNVLRSFDFLIRDGIAMYIASKILYGISKQNIRTTGTDFFEILFGKNKYYRFYLIGGAYNIKDKINSNYNWSGNFTIVNHECEPHNEDYDINLINSSKADILMVALGTPRQEEWIVHNKDLINVPIIIGVGSGLDLLAGVKKRAPLVMQNIGLEWLYRLFQEPKRLWRRYIFGIPVFMFHIVVQKVKLVLKKISPEC